MSVGECQWHLLQFRKDKEDPCLQRPPPSAMMLREKRMCWVALWPAGWPMPGLLHHGVARFSEEAQKAQWTSESREEDLWPLHALVSLPSAPSVFLS